MLFTRKNAAILAAFLAPSAYAQTAAVVAQNNPSCNSTSLVTLNLYAPVTSNTATAGPLALTVIADLTQPCTTVGGAAGFTITSLTGSYGNGANGAGGAITFLPGTTNGGDQCLTPCANAVLDSAGLTFARLENNANVAYRYQYTSANGYVLQLASQTQQTTSLVGTGVQFNACKAPTPGAGVCTMGQTCSSSGVSFETLTATDNSGNRITVNVGFNPNANCQYTPTAAGTTNPQGLAITVISGSYIGSNLQLLGSGACFYPCSAAVLDPQGVQFYLRDATTGSATNTYVLSYTTTTTNGVSTSSYKLSGAVLSGPSIAQSCLASQPAFYASCPVSSTSTTMSSTSSNAIVISTPSISIPISIPTSGINTASVPVSVPTSSVVVTLPTSTGVVSIPTSTPSVSVPTSTPIVSIPTSSVSVPTSSVIATVPVSSATGSSVTGSVTAAPTSTPATRVSTTSASIATGPQTSVPTPFVITITISARKRQAAQYVGASGALTTDPTQAAVFNLVNGQLFSNGAIVSTGPAIPAQQPLAGGAQGTVTTVWTSTNNAVAWTNAVFANGAASFCVANNIVNTVFVGTPAAGCVPVALTQVAQAAVVAPIVSPSAAAGGVTIINNNNPVIGVYVTVNLTFGTTTLGNGTVITTTGLASTTSPLYANPSGTAYCVACAMSAIGASCPSSGVTVYTTACGCASTAPAVAVTCATCAPVTLPAATATAGASAAAAAAAAAAAGGSGAAAAAAAAAAGATAGAAAAATAGKTTFTGAASSFGVEAAALMAAGVALLL